MLLLLATPVQAWRSHHVLLPCLTVGDEDLNHVLEEASDGVDFEDAHTGREVGLTIVADDAEPVKSGKHSREDDYSDEADEVSVLWILGLGQSRMELTASVRGSLFARGSETGMSSSSLCSSRLLLRRRR